MAGEARDLKLKIDNVRKVFNTRNGEMIALNGVNLDIYENEFICVVGPSGCGKSTLLNIIAGLTEATSGTVYCNGKPVTGTGTDRGVVFQQYALFPWLTVKKNVMFALEMKGIKGKQAEEEAMKYLAKVDLEKFADHYPKELSGGMKRRAGLVQALLNEPEFLIVDEPTTGLDPEERIRIRNLLVDFSENRTVLFSTHVVEDLAAVCSQLAVMKKGRFLYAGSMKKLVRKAKGHVWICRAEDEIEARQIERRYHISSKQLSEDGVQIRVISEQRPDADCMPAEPTLEDAYIYVSGRDA